ncbi:hypothetical protein HG530_012834 [Fusarium avenaceum]|nr:hypothetical protein HG530_012834 [Fusarium avenaceum]
MPREYNALPHSFGAVMTVHRMTAGIAPKPVHGAPNKQVSGGARKREDPVTDSKAQAKVKKPCNRRELTFLGPPGVLRSSEWDSEQNPLPDEMEDFTDTQGGLYSTSNHLGARHESETPGEAWGRDCDRDRVEFARI